MGIFRLSMLAMAFSVLVILSGFRNASAQDFNPQMSQFGVMASTYAGYGAFYLAPLSPKHNLKGTFAFYLFEERNEINALQRSYNGSLGLEYQYDFYEQAIQGTVQRSYLIVGGSWYSRYENTDVEVGTDVTETQYSYRYGMEVGI